VRIATEDIVALTGIDWGIQSFLLEDLRAGTSVFYPADIWLTSRRRDATLYANREVPPLRVRKPIYSQILRTVPKVQPDGTWDSICKRRKLNWGPKGGHDTGSIEFGIRCVDLPKLDVASDSDPMVVVTMKTGLSSFQELYRTEVIMDNNNPVFKKKKKIPFSPEATTWIKFSVYDVDDADGVLVSAQDFCGYANVTLQTLAELGALGNECKLPVMRGDIPSGTLIIFDVTVKLEARKVADVPVRARDVKMWLDQPHLYLSDDCAPCEDSADVLNEIGAKSINEILATFSIPDGDASERVQEDSMMFMSALELMRANPAGARDFYMMCSKASKAYKKMRSQVSDGLIALAIENSHAVIMEMNVFICTMTFPQALDAVCMKFKLQMENFSTLCSYALKADLHTRLKFQMKVLL